MVPPFRLPTHLSTLRNSDLALERRFVDYLRLSKSVGVHPDLEEGMKVLDVGCGKGLAVYDMARIVGPNGRVVGVDVLDNFYRPGGYYSILKEESRRHYKHDLKLPRQRYMELIKAATFMRLDAESMPQFGDNTFDRVFSVLSFDYFQNKIRAIQEMLRVLKEGGELYLITQFGHIIVTDKISHFSEALISTIYEIRYGLTNERIERALKEKYDSKLKSYNLYTFLLSFFVGVNVTFRRKMHFEVYKIKKTRPRVRAKATLPQYLFAIPYSRGNVTFYTTIARPPK
ncbi:TPA: methyltransferase domain-containing protein [archaeon]|uniref:Methyltransferase domain-containing protein n=1 Tax=Candidatus Naiadarchaeum limnaeum TaxID=2756139 RepID=A0A832XM82_9ARCH|nr:methyltransferase domain-containing protein [Candidatus Naiadarchaeales archaeon SRR2090153.bin1042]HIK00863.1 methyltransferase domain-containing protein [Candidatus Naiadarchaeum limnaeum]